MSDEFDPTVYEEFPAPRVGAVARHAGETLLAHVGLLVCMGLAVGGVALMADALVSSDGIAGLAGLAMLIFVARLLRWGFYYMCLRAVRDDDPRAADTLRPFINHHDRVVQIDQGL